MYRLRQVLSNDDITLTWDKLFVQKDLGKCLDVTVANCLTHSVLFRSLTGGRLFVLLPLHSLHVSERADYFNDFLNSSA